MTTTGTAVRTYQIDKSHSEAVFQVRHLLTKVRGHFRDFEGAVQFNDAEPGRSSVEFTIQAASIDTSEPDRDAHLRSADFFAVEQFPTLTFHSTRVTPRGEGRYDVEGDLTIRGMTKRVTVPVAHLGEAKDPWGNERLGFEAEIMLDRKAFGLVWNAALETGGLLLGDEVRVSLSVQAIAR